jgi:predicted Fe-Mo cluster-binding NifX family protein
LVLCLRRPSASPKRILPKVGKCRAKQESNVNIAVVSDDGVVMSQHFGRAPFYVVFSVEDGKITGREVRSKVYHHHGAADQHHGEGEHGEHGAGRDHGGMVSPIADCEVILAGGMGQGAFVSLRAQGIEPAFVRAASAEDAVAEYLAGRVLDRSLCQH